jgi:hypothetical protein
MPRTAGIQNESPDQKNKIDCIIFSLGFQKLVPFGHQGAEKKNIGPKKDKIYNYVPKVRFQFLQQCGQRPLLDPLHP